MHSNAGDNVGGGRERLMAFYWLIRLDSVESADSAMAFAQTMLSQGFRSSEICLRSKRCRVRKFGFHLVIVATVQYFDDPSLHRQRGDGAENSGDFSPAEGNPVRSQPEASASSRLHTA
jgi:hypothetical protein